MIQYDCDSPDSQTRCLRIDPSVSRGTRMWFDVPHCMWDTVVDREVGEDRGKRRMVRGTGLCSVRTARWKIL